MYIVRQLKFYTKIKYRINKVNIKKVTVET